MIVNGKLSITERLKAYRHPNLPRLSWMEDPSVKGKRRWSWIVCDPWTHRVDGAVIHVPAGFRTDLASIPRCLWWIPGYAPMELGSEGPIAHDWLYRHGGVARSPAGRPRWFNRRQVDLIFRTLMVEAGVGRVRRTVAWLAVRGFGWLCWKKAG